MISTSKAIKESIKTQNTNKPIPMDRIVQDVFDVMGEMELTRRQITSNASYILRNMGYEASRVKGTRRWEWTAPHLKVATCLEGNFKDECADCKHFLESEKKPEPKDKDLSMAQVGEAMVAYISDLKTKIQKLADQVSAEQHARKQVKENFEGQIKAKDESIKKLNGKLIVANKRILNQDGNGNTFNLSEIARFNHPGRGN